MCPFLSHLSLVGAITIRLGGFEKLSPKPSGFLGLPEKQVVFMRGSSAARLPEFKSSSMVYQLCDLRQVT